MEIKKTYRTPYMAIDLCKDENKKIYIIICTRCNGQRTYELKTWNETQKKLSELIWLTNAIEAPRS